MKFSIVTPFYNNNEGKYIDEIYNSVISQTHQDWEWVITDDFSSDGTLERLKKFDDPRIRLVTQKEKKELFFNPHLYSYGDIVVQLDSDDKMYPKALEVYNHFFAKYPDVFFMSVGTNYVEENGEFYSSQIIHHGDFNNCLEKKLIKDDNWKNNLNFLHFNGAWGNLQAWRNVKEIDFNPKKYKNLIYPDINRALTLEEYGNYLHLPRTLYQNNMRDNSQSQKQMNNDEILEYCFYLEDVKNRRPNKLNSYDKRYNDVFEETYMMLYSDLSFETDRKNISIFNVEPYKEKKIEEIYFDHNLFFNKLSDDIDYYFFFIRNLEDINFVKENNLNGALLYIPFSHDKNINLSDFFSDYKFHKKFYGSQILYI